MTLTAITAVVSGSKPTSRAMIFSSIGFLLAMAPSCIAQEGSVQTTFSTYARYGADVWARNPTARIAGEGQACISCHTSLPYALVEPLLGADYPAYRNLIKNVNNRISTWSDNAPWYSDSKLEKIAALSGAPPDSLKKLLHADQSRGVEAVFNALIRATHDAYSNVPPQQETRTAFRNMWQEQVRSGPAAGRWRWLDASLVPWEVTDSGIWGASLACVAASIFPDLAPEANLQALHVALKDAFGRSDVSLHAKSGVLWCDSETGGRVLEGDVAKRLVETLLALQRDNGGWALRDLGRWADWEGSPSDCCQNRELRSDAYATGFVTLVLTRSDRHLTNGNRAQLEKSIGWINRELTNPYPDGPRYNRHNSTDNELPEFRNSLYTNAGHMWAFLAKTAYRKRTALWAPH